MLSRKFLGCPGVIREVHVPRRRDPQKRSSFPSIIVNDRVPSQPLREQDEDQHRDASPRVELRAMSGTEPFGWLDVSPADSPWVVEFAPTTRAYRHKPRDTTADDWRPGLPPEKDHVLGRVYRQDWARIGDRKPNDQDLCMVKFADGSGYSVATFGKGPYRSVDPYGRGMCRSDADTWNDEMGHVIHETAEDDQWFKLHPPKARGSR